MVGGGGLLSQGLLRNELADIFLEWLIIMNWIEKGVKYYKYVKLYLHGYLWLYMEEIMALREHRQSVDNHTIVWVRDWDKASRP